MIEVQKTVGIGCRQGFSTLVTNDDLPGASAVDRVGNTGRQEKSTKGQAKQAATIHGFRIPGLAEIRPIYAIFQRCEGSAGA
jgi:hypothetical protein